MCRFIIALALLLCNLTAVNNGYSQEINWLHAEGEGGLVNQEVLQLNKILQDLCGSVPLQVFIDLMEKNI